MRLPTFMQSQTKPMNATTSLFHRILLAVCSILLVAACQQLPTDTTDKKDEDKGVVLAGDKIQLLPGFEAELLFSPSDEDMGSWVSLTKDDKGNLIASDQYGRLFRISPPPIGDPNGKIKVDSLNIPLGHAHGLLWAYNSLYVVVNADEGKGIEENSSGLYRVFDSNGDGELDDFQHLKSFDGHGEHGPHAVLPTPDGKNLIVVGGNHTELPEGYTSRIPTWDTDNLMPTLPDPRGHAIHRPPPGTWIAKTDSVGSFWELISVGYRNPYDIAFNEAGELFAFDSDMEWDLGMPWYRPIRVCHVTSGSEYGWRKGSGKWPEYYPDNLPPVANIGQGSPTGVVMGTGASFPARFQHGLFVFDWSFGTMYFVDLVEDGSSYRGEVEEFLSGVPLPLTDGVVGDDGAMYFATGGRRLASGLYRVTYTGSEDSSPAPLPTTAAQAARDLRHELEMLHGNPDPGSLGKIWTSLSHQDRFIRYAARIALENLPVSSWSTRLSKESDPNTITEAAIALAHQGSASDKALALDALHRISWTQLSEDQQLALVRAYGLVGIRLGAPTASQANKIIRKLDPHFPANTTPLNRELAYLLAFLDAPTVVDKTLALMQSSDNGETHGKLLTEALAERSDRYGKNVINMLKNMPPTQEIAYAFALSQVNQGWTTQSREAYFQWFFEALGREGGMSYKGFIDAIRVEALKRVPDAEKERLVELSGQYEPKDLLADLPQPKGPGKAYNPSDIRRLWTASQKKEEVRDFANGKKMYSAVLCASCHTMRGQGNSIGPDLTQIGTRFSIYDLAYSITSPSVEISDQYAYTAFTLQDGSMRVGRIVEESDTEISICPNPYAPDELVKINPAEVSKRELSKVSPMPPALINRLNEEELLDLLAYLLAGGDNEHEYF